MSARLVPFVQLIALLAWSSLPAVAQQAPAVPQVASGYRAPKAAPASDDIVGVAQQPFVGITLSDAVAMALSRNPDLAIAQANRRIASYQIMAAQGAYDVRFNIEPSYSHTVTAPQNAFFAGPGFGPIINDQNSLASGLSGVTPSGQEYSVNASGGRTLNNGTINSFNPTYPAALSFRLSQPLLRGRAINPASRQVQLAILNSQTSNAAALTSASQIVAGVSDTYWDLVAAWRNVAIQQEALRQAKLQSQSNARLVAQGVNAPIEVVQSNTQVNVFQDDVFSAIQNVERLQNQLKSLIVGNPADPIWNANLVPTSPVLELPPEPQLADMVAQAIAARPEFGQLAAAQAAAGVNVAYAKDQLKPQVNLEMGYTTSGFAGQLVPPSAGAPFGPQPQPPAYLVGGSGQSAQNLANGKFPSYQAGVNVQLPLGNRTAKANYAIAQEQARETQVNQISLLQRISFEVRNALQVYRSARSRLIAASAAREAAEQVFASETRRFRAGASTTFLVLQRQVDLAKNRGRELQAQTDLNKAVVELERVTGAILKENNVDATSLGQGTLTP
ncbi:MAG: TolC family protein [Vulcanimicrobiaceae bacterium]